MKKLFVSLLSTAAVTIALAAQSHNLTLFQDSIVNGRTLKAGEYRVTVEGGNAVIGKGKDKVVAPVKVEPAETKFTSTSVRYQNGDGKYRVKEIRIGGTNTKLIFSNPNVSSE